MFKYLNCTDYTESMWGNDYIHRMKLSRIKTNNDITGDIKIY